MSIQYSIKEIGNYHNSIQIIVDNKTLRVSSSDISLFLKKFVSYILKMKKWKFHLFDRAGRALRRFHCKYFRYLQCYSADYVYFTFLFTGKKKSASFLCGMMSKKQKQKKTSAGRITYPI